MICPSCQRAAAIRIDLTPKSAASIAPSRPVQRGVSRSSRTLGYGMRWTRQRMRRMRRARTAKSWRP